MEGPYEYKQSETMKIYVASSWKNKYQQEVVTALEQMGHQVYDFKKDGFRWEEIDENWKDWDLPTYVNALKRQEAERGYARDFRAMIWADAFVLVLPCGPSAHLEAGWAVGQGKPTCILLSECEFRPDLMYKMAGYIALTLESMKEWIKGMSCHSSQ